ncbi:hypothetical protein OG589_41195 [Sphaerisporangium sp. NBC_01403]|uniref:hypothetical protein n=1 Tax=Sphaerisporangium sp. NBC_01403 TaxID=2903599 RepID=UPI003244F7D5
MRRSKIVLTTAVLLATAAHGGTAQAASDGEPLTSVISAIKRQFAKKSSVHVSIKTREDFSGAKSTADTHGVYRFTRSGVFASDSTEIDKDPVSPGRFRMINIGRDSYTQSTDYSLLPKGKKWTHWRNADGFLWAKDLIDGLNPAFLTHVASRQVVRSAGGTVDGVNTTLYSGTVTVPELGTRQAGTTFDLKEGRAAGGQVKWKLWAGPDSLPRRFHAAISFEPVGEEKKGWSIVANMLYKQWGHSVKITAPPKNLTVEAG